MTARAAVIDTETTGLSDPIVPVEIAMFFYGDDWTDPHSKVFTERFNPGRKIEFGAMATHHIQDKHVANAQPFKWFSLPAGIEYLIGHNVDYDWAAIGKPNMRRICTLALSRMLWPEADSHKLGALVYMLGDEDLIEWIRDGAHSAQANAYVCDALLTKYILPKLSETTDWKDIPWTKNWESLWRVSEKARIPTVISFCKHKGMKIVDLPGDYVSWLLRQADLDPYLKIALGNR